MSLFDDVIVNVAAAVDAVGKKTTEVVDRSKVRVSSVELKNKISARFETLGRYVYDTHAAKNTDPSVVDQYVSEITVLINELKTLQDSLNASNGKTAYAKNAYPFISAAVQIQPTVFSAKSAALRSILPTHTRLRSVLP